MIATLNDGPATAVARKTTPLASPQPKFDTDASFRKALQRGLSEYFETSGRKQRDCPAMYVKTAIVLACYVTSYVLLAFFATTWWQAVPLAILVGLSLAAVGFNIQHDGGHGAYSSRRWVNKLMSLSLDFIGASSYVWDRKHNSLHHTYTNIADHDGDIDLGWLGRLSPQQRRLPFHRFQQFYLWLLYGFLPIKWHLYDDFRDLINGRVGKRRMSRPTGWDLAIFLSGKAVFYTMMFVLPMLLHPWWIVLTFYALAALTTGVVLSVVFQLAHCVEEAGFPEPSAETGRMDDSWAVHQVKTTVNFAPRSPVVTWLIGGLNCQVEHHLFPKVCHIHYPAVSRIVERTCDEFGLPYLANKTFFSAAASHYRWLRRMGQAEPSAAGT